MFKHIYHPAPHTPSAMGEDPETQNLYFKDLGAPENTHVYRSKKGYMTPSVWNSMVPKMIENIRGQEFFTKNPDHWFILFLDGLDSHVMYPDTLQLFLDNKIWVMKLPSHTSHVLQPLDLGFFKWEKEVFCDFIDDFARQYPYEQLDVWDTLHISITATIAIKLAMTRQIRQTCESSNIYPRCSVDEWYLTLYRIYFGVFNLSHRISKHPETLSVAEEALENKSIIPSINCIGEDNAEPCAANSPDRIQALFKLREGREVTQRQIRCREVLKREVIIHEAPIVRFMMYNYPHICAVMPKDLHKAVFKRVTKREMTLIRQELENNLDENVKWKRSAKHGEIVEKLLLFLEK